MANPLEITVDGLSTEIKFEFGDTRINRRANLMINKMVNSCEMTTPQAFSSQADLKGAYRFFDNNAVTPEKILQPHSNETIERCKSQNFVAVLQDSSDLDYDYLDCLEGFHSLHPNVDKGFRIHPNLVITNEGTPLGILSTINYTRNPSILAKQHRNSLSIEEKESYRWLYSYREACKLAEKAPNTTVVSIGDREGDIYECLAEAETVETQRKAHILVRSNHNRSLADGSDDTNNKLEKKLIRAPIIYEAHIDINRHRKNERTANIVVRATTVLIKAPNTCKKKSLPSITMNAILISEIDPPKNEPPLYWVLLTTLPINTIEEIQFIVLLYTKRWCIEIYFKVLKSGCKIDSPHLQSPKKIKNFISIAMIVAWKVLLATYLPREHGNAPCTIVFTEMEWKFAFSSAYKTLPLPEKTPTLKEATMWVAMLGGYQKRKEPPGIQTIWRGFVRLMDMIRGYEMAKKYPKEC